ncbi:ABC transporter permease subunit [Lachnospiraceae bacterium 54-53]
MFVTHDVDEAILLSDRVLFMSSKRIQQEIKVPISRPRIREQIYGTDVYRDLRSRIMGLFNQEVGNRIGGEEVCLFLNLWEYYTTKVEGVNTMLFPVPQKVFALYVTDSERIFMGVVSSLRLLFWGFFLALTLGIVMGMFVGWFESARSALFPIAKVLSPIPPIIYSPYAVALLPSFRSASIFVIFSSIFWTVFMNMILSVSSVDKKIMDSARTLNIKTIGMFAYVLLPNSLPMLFNSLTVSVSTSFMVLTAAEMIGATSGLGWYVKYYSDFADYTRVVAGIIVIGVVVTLLNLLIRLLRNAVIKWH